MKLEFKLEDFKKTFAPPLGDDDLEFIAAAASARLVEMLKDAPVVYCRMDDGKWAADEHSGFARSTHRARLVDIEKV